MSGTAVQNTFNAWINDQPGAGHTFIVKGEVGFPTSGWTASLVEADVPKIEDVIVLDVKSTRPSGNVLQVLTWVSVRFEKPKSPNYKRVTIRGAGPDFSLDVRIVH